MDKDLEAKTVANTQATRKTIHAMKVVGSQARQGRPLEAMTTIHPPSVDYSVPKAQESPKEFHLAQMTPPASHPLHPQNGPRQHAGDNS